MEAVIQAADMHIEETDKALHDSRSYQFLQLRDW